MTEKLDNQKPERNSIHAHGGLTTEAVDITSGQFSAVQGPSLTLENFLTERRARLDKYKDRYIEANADLVKANRVKLGLA